MNVFLRLTLERCARAALAAFVGVWSVALANPNFSITGWKATLVAAVAATVSVPAKTPWAQAPSQAMAETRWSFSQTPRGSSEVQRAVTALIGALVAFAVAVVLTPIAIRVALRTGVVDRPGALKVQEVPVAYLGGVAVFGGLAAGLLVHSGRPRLLLPLALALALGLADDLADLPPRVRLACEAVIGVAAAVVVPAIPGPLGYVITAVAVVGLLNAVNLLDGLDALASGVAAVSAIGFALLGPGPRPLGLALAGALCGFLVFNRPPARIYLGDAGAYLVGTALALACASALHADGAVTTWAALPLLVAVPVTDTAVAILRRRRAGAPLFAGDRSHVYDQLVDRGATRPRAVVVMVVAQAVLAAIGVLVGHLPPVAGVSGALLSAGILVALVGRGGFLTPAKEAS